MTMHRVGYLVNLNLRDKFFGYTASTDTLAYAGEILVGVADAPGDHDLIVCEEAFVELNRDDRPFGHTAPSLSVGDVLSIAGGNLPGTRYYSCDSRGFSKIEPPIETIPVHNETVADLMHIEADRLNAEFRATGEFAKFTRIIGP